MARLFKNPAYYKRYNDKNQKIGSVWVRLTEPPWFGGSAELTEPSEFGGSVNRTEQFGRSLLRTLRTKDFTLSYGIGIVQIA